MPHPRPERVCANSLAALVFLLVMAALPLRAGATEAESLVRPADAAIEASLLAGLSAQASAEEQGLLAMEVVTYLRQRRTKAAPFWAKFTAGANEKLRAMLRELLVCEDGVPLLARFDSLEAPIEEFLAGRRRADSIERLAATSVDRPWAYHCLPMESAGPYVAVIERDLASLVRGAQRASGLEPRIALLEIARSETWWLREVLAHSEAAEVAPARPITDPSNAGLRAALTALLADERALGSGTELITSADLVGQIVWQLWVLGRMPEVGPLRPPSAEGTDVLEVSAGALLPRVARDILSGKGPGLLPKPSAEEARELVDSFQDALTLEWRRRMSAFSWQQCFQLVQAVPRDADLRARLQARMLDWIQWDSAVGPASFAPIWEQHCAGQRMNVKSYGAILEWLRSEAVAGRFWTLGIDGQAFAPGLTLRLAPSRNIPPSRDKYTGHPVADVRPRLQGHLCSGYNPLGRAEFVLADGQLEQVGPENSLLQAVFGLSSRADGSNTPNVASGLQLTLAFAPPR